MKLYKHRKRFGAEHLSEVEKIKREVLKNYKITPRGTIMGPGKFQGEPIYVPVYWGLGLEGFANFDEVGVFGFELGPEDYAAFPELDGFKWLYLDENDQGFVYSDLSNEPPEKAINFDKIEDDDL